MKHILTALALLLAACSFALANEGKVTDIASCVSYKDTEICSSASYVDTKVYSLQIKTQKGSVEVRSDIIYPDVDAAKLEQSLHRILYSGINMRMAAYIMGPVTRGIENAIDDPTAPTLAEVTNRLATRIALW